jgi:hypothetical protein
MSRAFSKRNTYKILVGMPGGNRPLGRTRRRWKNNITIDLKEIKCCGIDWIRVAKNKGKVKGSCDHGNELSGSILFWGDLE